MFWVEDQRQKTTVFFIVEYLVDGICVSFLASKSHHVTVIMGVGRIFSNSGFFQLVTQRTFQWRSTGVKLHFTNSET